MPKIIFRPAPTPPPFVPPVPVAEPLTFTAREANSSVAFNIEGSVSGVSLLFSTDNGQTWNPYIFGQSVNLAAVGDSVMLKGDNNGFSVNDENYIYAVMTGKIAASGSIMFLIDSQGNNKALTPYCFALLFADCTSLVQAPTLPATDLAESCYAYMFNHCTSLTQAPALPATSLAVGCYKEMFYSCTSLVQAPTLPATDLAESCYAYMFNNCTSLVQAPALPASSLADGCYKYMFDSCTSLVQAPALPATSLADGCYANMFSNCTSLVQAPALPATSLAESCYAFMFEYCTSLNFVQCNATDISADGCLENWLESVSASGTFKKNPSMNDWPSGANGIPNGWTIEDI